MTGVQKVDGDEPGAVRAGDVGGKDGKPFPGDPGLKEGTHLLCMTLVICRE